MVKPETSAGAVGALLLIAAYGVVLAAFGPETVISFDAIGLVTFAGPAFVVGAAVAAFTRWYVPAERLTRGAHRRTVTVMLVGPTAIFGLVVALLALAVGATANVMREFEGLAEGASGASGPFLAVTAFLIVAGLIVAIVLLVILIVILVAMGVVLQVGAILGYALTTVALERMDGVGTTAGPTGEPPD